MGRPPVRVALLATLSLIALATLVPLGPGATRVSAQVEWSDVLVNLGLFLPLGVVLALQGWKPARVALFGLLLSAGIELLQATLIPGRRGSALDILTNLGGALAGALLCRAYLALRRAPSRGAFALAAAVLVVPVLGWLGCGLLLAPQPPPGPGDWWGQWAHHFEDTEPFRGRILSVVFLGRPVPDARLDSTAVLRAAARRGPLTLEVTLRSGGTAAGLTHLASVASADSAAVIGLEQRGDDLLLRWRSRGAGLALRRPQLTFPGALRSGFGEPLTITARVDRSRASATVTRGSEQRSAARRLTLLAGWRSLIPTRDLSARVQTLFDLVWTLGLAGYLGFAARVLRPLRVSY